MDKQSFDINIVGAGLAGLSCAITLAEGGFSCNLISYQASERAQSVMAEGGINAALDTMGENDCPDDHFKDTMKGGAELADPAAVAGLVEHAPEIVKWLVKIGVPFQMENGRLILRNFGGQKKKRTAYAKSSTGKAIMTAMIDEARKYEAHGLIRRYMHHEVLELAFEDAGAEGSFLGETVGKGTFAGCRKKCTGVIVKDRFTGEIMHISGPTVLASGGLNGLFPGKTTGTVHNTGALTAAVFAAGGSIANPEFIQYHPTTVGIPGKRMLISEAARGEGGRLYIMREGKPWYFMEELYPELGNLMPRDVVSREIVKACSRDDCEPQVYLDLSHLKKDAINEKLSDMRQEILDYLHVDIAEEAVMIEPGIHFFMGGIMVDKNHRTDFPFLYAAGECACQYHGANRLGGNSMLGAVYGGRVSAGSVMEDAGNFQNRTAGSKKPCGAEDGIDVKQYELSPVFFEQLCGLIYDALGIIREKKSLERALYALKQWMESRSSTEAEMRCGRLAEAMLKAALERKESRGAHFRSDYPEKDDKTFRKTTVARWVSSEVQITFRDIPMLSGAKAENERLQKKC